MPNYYLPGTQTPAVYVRDKMTGRMYLMKKEDVSSMTCMRGPEIHCNAGAILYSPDGRGRYQVPSNGSFHVLPNVIAVRDNPGTQSWRLVATSDVLLYRNHPFVCAGAFMLSMSGNRYQVVADSNERPHHQFGHVMVPIQNVTQLMSWYDQQKRQWQQNQFQKQQWNQNQNQQWNQNQKQQWNQNQNQQQMQKQSQMPLQRSARQYPFTKPLRSGKIILDLSSGRILGRQQSGMVFWGCYGDITEYINPIDATWLRKALEKAKPQKCQYQLSGLSKDAYPVEVEIFTTEPGDEQGNPYESPCVGFRCTTGQNTEWVVRRNRGAKLMKELVDPASQPLFPDQGLKKKITATATDFNQIDADKIIQWIENGKQIGKGGLFEKQPTMVQRQALVFALNSLSDKFRRAYANTPVAQRGMLLDPNTKWGKIQKKICKLSLLLRELPRHESASVYFHRGKLNCYPDDMLFDGLNGFIPGCVSEDEKGKKVYQDGQFRYYCDFSNSFIEFSQTELNEFKQKYCGLANLGSTCFMNAALKFLFSSPAFRLILKKLDLEKIQKNALYTPDGFQSPVSKYLSTLYQLAKLERDIEFLVDQGKEFYSPRAFRKALGTLNPQFAKAEANDAGELFRYLTENLHALMAPKIPVRPNQLDQGDPRSCFTYAQKYFFDASSPISSLFYGICGSISHCDSCDGKVYAFQQYEWWDIPLYSVKDGDTLAKLLSQNMNAVEERYGDNGFHCVTCKGQRDGTAVTHSLIEELPEFFVLNLDAGKDKKYDRDVRLADGLEFTNEKTGRKEYYVATAVMSHTGRSGGSGHYITFERNKNGTGWKKYDDSKVIDLNADAINAVCKGGSWFWRTSPRLIHYQRVEPEDYCKFKEKKGLSFQSVAISSYKDLGMEGRPVPGYSTESVPLTGLDPQRPMDPNYISTNPQGKQQFNWAQNWMWNNFNQFQNGNNQMMNGNHPFNNGNGQMNKQFGGMPVKQNGNGNNQFQQLNVNNNQFQNVNGQMMNGNHQFNNGNGMMNKQVAGMPVKQNGNGNNQFNNVANNRVMNN